MISGKDLLDMSYVFDLLLGGSTGSVAVGIETLVTYVGQVVSRGHVESDGHEVVIVK